jgi:hypothetical protein
MILGSLVWCFTEFVDVGDDRFGDQASFPVGFCDFGDRGFSRLEMAFWVAELFVDVTEFVVGILLNAGEFGVDNFDRLL